MFEAYNLHSLAKLSVHIESIAVYDKNIILGTRQGQLLNYYVAKVKGEMELKLHKFDKFFSKKAIVQIEVVPKDFLLFTLSDSMIRVSCMTGMNFDTLCNASQTKGASLFCIDVSISKSSTGENKPIIKVCVAIKRKLQFFFWENNMLVDMHNSIDLKDLPKSISMLNEFVCVGFKDEYVLYDSNHVKHNLMDTSSLNSQDPCVCIIDNVFGLIKDQFLIGVDPVEIQELNTSPCKEESKNKSINELASERCALLQSSQGSRLTKPLQWSESVLDLVWDEPYILGRTQKSLEVRCFDTNGLNKESLIQSFPELGKARFIKISGKGTIFAAALSELWFLEYVDINKQMRSILSQKKFQLAIDLTNTTDKPEEEKEKIIKTIQSKYAQKLFDTNQFRAAMQEFARSKTYPSDVIRLFRHHLGIYPNENQQMSPSNEPNVRILEGKDLQNALLAFQDYLNFARQEELKRLSLEKDTKKSKKKNYELLSILDTTLLKTYLQTNDSRIERLLRDHYCIFNESEKTLKSYKRYSELKILYYEYGKHREALELLKEQSQIPGTRLSGCEQTIKYLQELGAEHKFLIFEFADWVLKTDPKAGLKIFTENFEEVKNLPRPDVLDFLLKGHKPLAIPYLEHIIEEWNDERPLSHNYLIKQYRDKIDSLKNELEKQDIKDMEKVEALKETRAKFLKFLKTSEYYNLENVLKDLPTNDLFEERAIILGKLKKHIKVLVIYIQILGDIEKAIEYCDQIYPEDNTILVLLIKTLLNPPTTPPYRDAELHPICKKPNTDTVLGLLDKYGTKLDPVEVLSCLPSDIPVSRLKNFLESALRSNIQRQIHLQVSSSLLYAEELQLKEQLMNEHMKSIVLTDLTICQICRKRFTNQSAFVRYPNGEIVHFSCHDNPS